MRAINVDTLEWFQVTFGMDKQKAILILKPHINNLDIIEAAPIRHGRWIPTRPNVCSVKCSICEKFWETETPYCPSCGAKMDAEEPTNE